MEANTKQTESGVFNQVSFFRSYFESIEESGIDDAEKGRLYSAIMHYAFDGTESDLTGVSKALFTLMKPYIAKSRKCQEAGKKGGKSDSRHQANSKQTQSESEAKAKAEGEQKRSNNIHTSTSISQEKGSAEGKGVSAEWDFDESGYPLTVDGVLAIAESPQCGVKMSRESAEKYLITRLSSDWVDAAKRRIKPERLVWDVKKWALESSAPPRSSAPAKPREKTADEIFEEL